MSTNRDSGDAPHAPLVERRLMAAHPITIPGAHERRLAERTRSARLIRESICLLSSKWSVDILLALGDGTRRYHELLEDLQPISEKVLTQTLRGMERDGLVARRVHAEVPPRVEYALTSLGATMAPPLKALGAWSLAHGKRVEEARDRFEARAAARRAA
jgi:DNA-binding HxlR family transcriptional regulator